MLKSIKPYKYKYTIFLAIKQFNLKLYGIIIITPNNQLRNRYV